MSEQALTIEERALLFTVLERAQKLGFIGKNADLNSEISHSLRFGKAISHILGDSPDWPSLRCLDIGSGGGLPALVVSLGWKETSWTLNEISAAKCDFLEWAIRRLGVASRAIVAQCPIEKVTSDLDHKEECDLVTARAFAPTAKVLELATDLLKPGRFLLVSNAPLRKHENFEGSSLFWFEDFENISVFQKIT